MPTCQLGSPSGSAAAAVDWDLALPLEELPPKAAERALAVTVYPLRLRAAQPPLPKGEARKAFTLGSPSGRAITAGD